MNQRSYPATLFDQAKTLAAALEKIDPNLKAGELTVAALKADLDKGAEFQRTISALEIQLTDQRNRRDAHYGELWKKVKRMRAAVKAIYGDDSSQYEVAGGTRVSERKPRNRKAKPAA